eukprot:11174155-Lingulodinium_polyedra.AAC.1
MRQSAILVRASGVRAVSVVRVVRVVRVEVMRESGTQMLRCGQKWSLEVRNHARVHTDEPSKSC